MTRAGRGDAGHWLFEVVLAGLTLFAAVPLWMVEVPPIQDLPQHLAAIRVMHDYGDPELGFARYFTVELARTQYLAYYAAANVASWVVGVELANRLLLTAAIVATPYALRALLRELGRDARHTLFVLPLTWNAHLILGFLNFVAAIPLALYGLALACRLRGEWSLRRAIGLALVLLVTFYTHVVPFAFLALGTGLLLVGDSLRSTARRATVLVPAAVAAVAWAFVSPAGQSTMDAALGGGDGAGRVEPEHAPWMQSLQETPKWLTDVLTGTTDDRLLIAWGLLVLSAWALAAPRAPTAGAGGGGASMARRVGILAPLAALAYFVTPVSHDWIWPINARFPLLAAVFLPLVLPPLRRVGALMVFGGMAVVAFLSTLEVARAFEGYEREVGQLDTAIEAIPPGERVAGLVFDRGSRHVKFSPFLHSVAWYQARRGGAVMFTFADFPQSPIRFRDDRRPPPVGPRWEWMPGRVDPRRDLDWYDYVLVRGGPGRIARQRDVYEPIHRSHHWSVWRRTDR